MTEPAEPMIILTQTFDLLSWLIPHTDKYPRLYRTTVTRRLIDAALDFQEAIYEANARTGKARLSRLESADAQLNKVRLYLRLAHHWQWMTDGQYQHVSLMVARIGKLLGGWIAQTQQGLATK